MLPGEVVAGRFELDRLSEVGGMGAVYRARDRLTEHVVAVKLLRAPGGVHDERFLREAALLAELRHPAIVRHIAHGRTAEGELYLAMEWLDGEDLGRRLRRGPLAPAEAVALIERIADGLALLHARGGVHRDLKPANLFLEGGRPERAKLLDFGIARAAAALAVTSTGTVMGTPGYTAPEQARGSKDVDARADVFALGCVLFECITGKAAFRGDHVMAVLAKVLLEDPPRLGDAAPDAPAELEALVARLMHKDPTRRPRDAGEVREALAQVGRGASHVRLISPLTPRPASLGSDEQRFMCLALCTLGEDVATGATGIAAPLSTVTAVGSEPTLAPDAVGPDTLVGLVRSHGARLERLADGSWVALPDRATVRAPATDQAAQVARVALALSKAMPTARVAVAAGRGVQAGRAPVGEVIDRALRLVRGAGAVGAVMVDPLTAGLLGGGFELRDEGAALRLIGEAGDAAPLRRVLGKPTPCVGRDRELSTLMGLFDEVIAEPCARAVLVRGPAGHGKSRLRVELQARLRARGVAFEWLLGKGDPVHVGAPFGLAADVVRRAAGIVDGEAVEVCRDKLAARVGAVVAPAERARVAAFLGELAHVPADEASAGVAAARRDPTVMGDHLRRAWDDWLAAETERRPVVLVLEDLHLGDLSTVKLCDSALRNLRERPLLVLALARPEIDLAFPGLWAERDLATIPLGELSKRAATRLVAEILGDDAIATTVARIVDQAAGNAFYLEELCRVVRDGPAGELPGTVLAMAQARLEGLDADARRLLRAAAIFGERFPRGGVLALWGDADDGPRVDRLLAGLVERELCEPVGAAIAGEPSFGFRHGLVREAAYAMLTDRDRELGHRLAGEWLAAAGVADPVMLADHFERGGVAERAVTGYLTAARDALEGNDLVAVLTRVERGLACGARGAELGELLVLRAEAHRWRADYTASLEAAQLAMAVLPPGGRGWCVAATASITGLVGLSAYDRLDDLLSRVSDAPPLDRIERLRCLSKGCVNLYLIGRYERADALLASIEAEVARGGAADEPFLDARLDEARAFAEGARAEQGRALALLERVAVNYRRAGDLRGACLAQNNVGYTYVQLGAYGRAAALLEATLHDAERMGQIHVEPIVRQNLGLALCHLGHHDRGERLQREAVVAFERQHDQHMAAVSRTYLAQQLLIGGELAAARGEAEHAVRALASTPPARALALATLAQIHVAAGAADAALAPAREAYSILETLGGLDEGELLVRVAWAQALAAVGRAAEAAEVVTLAAARLAALAATLPDELRATYLTAVPENALVRRLAPATTA